MDSKFFLYTPVVIIIGCLIFILGSLFYAGKTNESNKVQKPKYVYLNKDNTIYTKGDTLLIDNRKFIKVYGITHCKYKCPVLIECK